MPTERLTFTGHDGADLDARLDLPEGPHLATALFAHCFTCSKQIHAARRIAARLAGAGIAVLRFDFTGLGHSGGEFENTTFTSNVEDLELAAKALEARGLAPGLLIGHSLGGAAVLRVARRIPSVRAVVTIGAPFDPGHVTRNFKGALDEIAEHGAAEVDLGGQPVRIGRAFVEDVRADALAPEIAGLKAALLVMHAPRDEVVGIDNAAQIFRAAKHPKSFVTLCDSDHLITRASDAEYAAEVIATWAARYLDLQKPAPPPGAPEGVVRVSEADPDGYLQDIDFRPAPSHPCGRAAGLWRHGSRHVALRFPVGGSWRLHVDDDPHVCAAQGLAAGSCARRCMPRQGSCTGCRCQRRGQGRSVHARRLSQGRSVGRPARASAGNRRQMPCAPHVGGDLADHHARRLRATRLGIGARPR